LDDKPGDVASVDNLYMFLGDSMCDDPPEMGDEDVDPVEADTMLMASVLSLLLLVV
jgi:hypothetical protein